MKKINVEIDENGDCSIDLENFHGKGCSEVLKDFSGDDRVKVERTKREYRDLVQQKERAKS